MNDITITVDEQGSSDELLLNNCGFKASLVGEQSIIKTIPVIHWAAPLPQISVPIVNKEDK